MKILKKQIINTQIAEHRRQQIEEGLSLAKKIDALRNELLELQKKRTDFIEGTKSELQQQLKSLYQEKEKLEEEIKCLNLQKQT